MVAYTYSPSTQAAETGFRVQVNLDYVILGSVSEKQQKVGKQVNTLQRFKKHEKIS